MGWEGEVGVEGFELHRGLCSMPEPCCCGGQNPRSYPVVAARSEMSGTAS